MAEYSLKAEPFLGNFTKSYDGVELREIEGNALVSLALPLGEEGKATKIIESKLGISVADVGSSNYSDAGEMRLLRLGQDQVFLSFAHSGTDPVTHIAEKLDGAVYLTDQTHVWVVMEISGPKARVALERICPIDLHPDSFAVGQLARTSMEHLGTVIVRIADDSYQLMSASSSAKSLLHALETSINNVQ